jgi:hypothetical protein
MKSQPVREEPSEEETEMPEASVQEILSELELKREKLGELLEEGLDFMSLEVAVHEAIKPLEVSLLKPLLHRVLKSQVLLSQLKKLGGYLGMRFKGYRQIEVRLGNGEAIEVSSPYFSKAKPKSSQGRRAKRRERGSHLGLAGLGFIGRCSTVLVSEVVQTAVLCPSFEVAHTVLKRRGLELDIKTVRRLCGQLGERGLALRGSVALAADEDFSGHTLVIGIDGGRLRERRRKRTKAPDQKRHGYHSDWREPKLFTLYVLDEKGRVVRECAPLHDATLGDHEAMFELLECYLKALDLNAFTQIVFCGDGASWIWSDTQALCDRLGLEAERVVQVIDYTHAKQNLQEIVDQLPPRQRPEVVERWRELLWQGDLSALGEEIEKTIRAKASREKALKKWRDYFDANQKRMQYHSFHERHLPCGSGCVESAIRRVINLRLKAPGTFWSAAMAECFLFLRSQLLSGRWDRVIDNIAREAATLIRNLRVGLMPKAQPAFLQVV